MKNILLIFFFLPITSFSISKVVKTFYPNGQLLSEITYKDGKRDGPCNHYWASVYFWEKSQIKSEVNYKQGKQVGLYKSYYENGQLENQGTYKFTNSGSYSRKDGVWKTYYNNGQLKIESIIKDDIQLEWNSYNLDGDLHQRGKVVLKEGVRIDYKVYDSEGKLLPMAGGC